MRNIIQQDSKNMNGYLLGIVSLIIVLFIPFSILILKMFKNPMVAAFILGVGIPFIAIIVGAVGLAKSLRHSTPLAKTSKILNIISIIVGIILVIFNASVIIKSGGLNL